MDEGAQRAGRRRATSTGGAGPCARCAKRRRCATRSSVISTATRRARRACRRERFTRRCGSSSRADVAAGRLTLSPERPTPLGWRIRNLLHLHRRAVAAPAGVAAAPRRSRRSALVSAPPAGENGSRAVSSRGRPGVLRRAGAAGRSRRHQPVQRDGQPEAGPRAALDDDACVLLRRSTTPRGTSTRAAAWRASARSTSRAGSFSTAGSG